MSSNSKLELITVRDYLRYAVSRFHASNLVFGHGCTNAWDEAVYLTLHTLGLPPEQLEVWLDARLMQQERETLLEMYRRRCQERLPVAYLTRQAWLAGASFYVDERVIVPRSFIAELLCDQLSPWVNDPEGDLRILDLCTGSGCLAILSALNFPGADVDAVDISAPALQVAARNVSDYGLEDRVHLLQGDSFQPVAGRRYDLIICNPPYVDARAMQQLPAEYRHEPALALQSGVDGLDFTRRLLSQAKHHLTPHGVLLVEVGHQREVLEQAYPDCSFTWLETEAGSDYVFLLNAEDLID